MPLGDIGRALSRNTCDTPSFLEESAACKRNNCLLLYCFRIRSIHRSHINHIVSAHLNSPVFAQIIPPLTFFLFYLTSEKICVIKSYLGVKNPLVEKRAVYARK